MILIDRFVFPLEAKTWLMHFARFVEVAVRTQKAVL